MAISMRLNTRRQTTIATPTRFPRYTRNDKAGTHQGDDDVGIQNYPHSENNLIPERMGLRSVFFHQGRNVPRVNAFLPRPLFSVLEQPPPFALFHITKQR